ncbi:MAG: CDP-6-deoxy-delta-3,4-glucoseen reductase [Burkholderiaceae bacterium]
MQESAAGFKVVVRPSGREFVVGPQQSVLEAALANDIVLPYGCRDGACGSCKAKVLEGTVEHGPHASGALKPAEQEQGYALLCCAHPRADLVVQARVLEGVANIPLRKMPVRVTSLEMAAPDVAVLRLQMPANEQLQYLAGQYIEILLRDGTRREYSLGSAPSNAEQLELHVRHMPGGKFTDTVFGVATPPVKEKSILRFEGPLGTFFLREDSTKPIVMLASGTGFAPIKAIIEHMLFKDIRRPVVLYWGGRRPRDLYRNELCQQWAAEHAHIRYVPVISDALPEDGWQGRTGFVHRAVIEDFPDLSGHQVYACGAPIVVNSAQADFIQTCGLPAEEFFADSFTTEADVNR